MNWRKIEWSVNFPRNNLYFLFFQLTANNMLLMWSAQIQNAVPQLPDQAMLACTFAARQNVKTNQLTMDRIQILDLLHFWIICVEPFVSLLCVYLNKISTYCKSYQFICLLSSLYYKICSIRCLGLHFSNCTVPQRALNPHKISLRSHGSKEVFFYHSDLHTLKLFTCTLLLGTIIKNIK